MGELRNMQTEAYRNKVDHGFNVTDVPFEFCLLQTELSEAFHAHLAGDKENLGEELADVAIYLMGLSEICGIDLEAQILRKLEKNRQRRYFRDGEGKWRKEEGPDFAEHGVN